MQTVLIVIHLFVAIALTIVVLLQRSEGGALGMGGGGGGGGLGGFFSPRGAANTLTRTTAILGLLFFLSSAALTWLALNTHQSRSVFDQPGQGTTAPAAPGVPPSLPASRSGVPPSTTAPATAPASSSTTAPAPVPAATTPAPAPQTPAVPPSR